jgi:hypothetical protein
MRSTLPSSRWRNSSAGRAAAARARMCSMAWRNSACASYSTRPCRQAQRPSASSMTRKNHAIPAAWPPLIQSGRAEGPQGSKWARDGGARHALGRRRRVAPVRARCFDFVASDLAAMHGVWGERGKRNESEQVNHAVTASARGAPACPVGGAGVRRRAWRRVGNIGCGRRAVTRTQRLVGHLRLPQW